MAATKEISLCELTRKLEVTPPYLSLEDITQHPNREIVARVRPEQPMYRESGAIAACEVGRHLALLGSISLAQQNPSSSRHFYLATSARLTNLHKNAQPGSDLVASVTSASLDRKTGNAACIIRQTDNDERALYELNTNYQVLSERLFSRMFKQHYCEQPLNIEPPSVYGMRDTLEIDEQTRSFCSTQPMTVESGQCLGHFPNYPCLPVAILMGRLGRVAGALFQYRAQGEIAQRYCVLSADIEANRLAFAGEQLRFEATFIDRKATVEEYSCKVTNLPGDLFAEMRVRMESQS